MNEYKKRAVLIGAGEAEGIFFYDSLKKDGFCNKVIYEDVIIALDGGLVYCEKNNIRPDYIIGDFDSLPEEKKALLAKYPQERILRLPCEKDDTDMLAAIKFAAQKGITDFIIYGGLGGRLSHTIANLQCLMFLKEHGMTGILFGADTKVFLLQNESYIFDENESGYISVFAYSETVRGITLKNLKYELTDSVLTPSFPLGVSNEFIPGKPAEICVKDGALLVVLDR